jgi:hypothetical protein
VVSFPQASPPKSCMHLSSYWYMPDVPPSDSYGLECTNNTGWKVQITKLFIMQSFHSTDTSFLLGPNILLRTLFSNTLSLDFSLSWSDHVSHP